MEIKVDINAEDINKSITKAIAESAIGTELKRAINAEVEKLSSTL